MTVKWILYFLFGMAFLSFGQEAKKAEQSFKKESQSLSYGPDKKKKREKKQYYNSGPEDIEYREGKSNEVESEGSYEAISDEQIKSYRQKQNKKSRDQKNSLEKPNPIDIPTFDPPDIEGPDVDLGLDKLPDPDNLSKETYRTILFFLFITAILLILYFLLRRFDFKNRFRPMIEEEWHPTLTPTDDFLNRLELAEKSENYREAVRILFTLILKELVRLEYIKWTKEKTNASYIFEIKQDAVRSDFRKCVYYFDLVWYGEYLIQNKEYTELTPIFKALYDNLKSKNIEN